MDGHDGGGGLLIGKKRIEVVCSIGCSFSRNRAGGLCLPLRRIKRIINPLLFCPASSTVDIADGGGGQGLPPDQRGRECASIKVESQDRMGPHDIDDQAS